MKRTKLLSSLIAVFAGIVLFVPNSALAAAFGVSPPWIENDNLKAGSNFVYVIDLSANELAEDMMIQAELTGDPEITQWLVVQSEDNLVMPKGKSIVPMNVSVNVPENAVVGKYEGNLKLSLSAKTDQANQIAVLLGGNIRITLNVIDYDVIDYQVRSIDADPTNEGQAINLEVRVKNMGNTRVTNIMTDVSVIDKITGEVMVSSSVDQLSVPIQPQTTKSAKLSVPAPNLQTGSYWVDVESFKDGASIYNSRLHLVVEPSILNNALGTDVRVVEEGEIRPAASIQIQNGAGATVQTTVKVRAPYTDKLILVVIGILLVLTGVLAKFYVTFKKKRR